MNKNIKIMFLLSTCLISQVKGAELLDVKRIGEQQGYGEDSFDLSWSSEHLYSTKESEVAAKKQALSAILIFLNNHVRNFGESEIVYTESTNGCGIKSEPIYGGLLGHDFGFYADTRLLSKEQGLELTNILQQFINGRPDDLLKLIGRNKIALDNRAIAETLRDEIYNKFFPGLLPVHFSPTHQPIKEPVAAVSQQAIEPAALQAIEDELAAEAADLAKENARIAMEDELAAELTEKQDALLAQEQDYALAPAAQRAIEPAALQAIQAVEKSMPAAAQQATAAAFSFEEGEEFFSGRYATDVKNVLLRQMISLLQDIDSLLETGEYNDRSEFSIEVSQEHDNSLALFFGKNLVEIRSRTFLPLEKQIFIAKLLTKWLAKNEGQEELKRLIDLDEALDLTAENLNNLIKDSPNVLEKKDSNKAFLLSAIKSIREYKHTGQNPATVNLSSSENLPPLNRMLEKATSNKNPAIIADLMRIIEATVNCSSDFTKDCSIEDLITSGNRHVFNFKQGETKGDRIEITNFEPNEARLIHKIIQNYFETHNAEELLNLLTIVKNHRQKLYSYGYKG